MGVDYPASLDSGIGQGSPGADLSTGGAGGQSHLAAHEDISTALVALETRVGATDSTDQSSLDYLIRQVPPKLNFSFSEQDSGSTWVDGRRIYQKSVDVSPLPKATTGSTPHGILAIGQVIDIQGAATNPTGPQYFIRLPHVDPTNLSYMVGMYADGTNIVISTGYDMSGYTSAHVTMRYTCTDR